MGEYAHRRPDGQHIKIGTCEDLYYLRYDQLPEITTKRTGDSDPRDHLDVYRFRFPFPDEDHIRAGDFDDPFRGINLAIPHPVDFDHGTVQMRSDKGYLYSIPCPEGPDAPKGVHRNGFPGAVRIVQQAVRNGRLVVILECQGCEHKYNLPTLEDAEPVLVALQARADEITRRRVLQDPAEAPPWEDPGTDPQVEWWHAIADRITEGYRTLVDTPATV